MGEIAPGVPLQDAKTCFVFFVIKATWPAFRPLTLHRCRPFFETTDVNRFAHAYTGENFSNFCAWNFPGPETDQNTVL